MNAILALIVIYFAFVFSPWLGLGVLLLVL